MAWSLIYLFASFGVKWSGDAEGYFLQKVLQISDSVNSLGGINWSVLVSLFILFTHFFP